MKPIFQIIFLFYSSFIYSQTNFAEIGTAWYYCKLDPLGHGDLEYDYQLLVSKKDTQIFTKNCRLVESLENKIYYHQDGHKVYYFKNNKFNLIYDFGVSLNDTIFFDFTSYNLNSKLFDTIVNVKTIVHKIDTIFFSNKKFKHFICRLEENKNFNHLNYQSDYEYIEKIGYEYNVMFKLGISSNFFVNNLRCFIDSNKIIHTNFWENYPLINKKCDYSKLSSINNFNTHDLEMFNNDGIFWLQNNSDDLMFFNIYNYLGNCILKSELIESKNKIDLSNLVKSIYLIQILDSNNKILLTQKIQNQ